MSKIIIDVDEESKVITVTVNDKDYIFESIALFAGNAEHKDIFIQMFGSSASAAWAYAQGFVMSQEDRKSSLCNFYKQCACHIAQIIDPLIFKNEVEATALLTQWAEWDIENGLVDKGKSENKKKWN